MSSVFRNDSPRCMHLDMDTFFASVERLLDPALNGRPLVIGGTPFQRGVVAGCSREARMHGVHSAMPLRQAYQLCPDAVFLAPKHTYYAEYSERVTELLEDQVPVLEKASIDEFYMDIAGCGRVFGEEAAWGAKLKRTLMGELGLPLTFGIARNKLVAKVATTVGKKLGDLRVPDGEEEDFLAPHVIRLMPGVGEVMEQDLLGMGIHLIGDIARLSPRILAHLFGKPGRILHEHARGIDDTPIRPTRRRKTLGSEHTFSEDVLEPRILLGSLHALAARVGEELRAQGYLTRRLTVKLRYADFVTVTRVACCEPTHADHVIYEAARRCFDDLYARRVRVRLLGISCGDLLENYEQLFLFSGTEETEHEERRERLYAGMDRIRRRHGRDALVYGHSLEHPSSRRRVAQADEP